MKPGTEEAQRGTLEAKVALGAGRPHRRRARPGINQADLLYQQIGQLKVAAFLARKLGN